MHSLQRCAYAHLDFGSCRHLLGQELLPSRPVAAEEEAPHLGLQSDNKPGMGLPEALPVVGGGHTGDGPLQERQTRGPSGQLSPRQGANLHFGRIPCMKSLPA